MQVSKDFFSLDRNSTLRSLQRNKNLRSCFNKDGLLARYCSSVLKGDFTIPPTSVVSAREDKDIESETTISVKQEEQDNVRIADHEYDSDSESEVSSNLEIYLKLFETKRLK